ncbi:MAG: PEP-CTERM sorting domain-containing protein [Verrucomicrobiota bacterium]
MKKTLLLAGALCLASWTHAAAAPLVSYEFTDASDRFAPTSVDPALTSASDFTGNFTTAEGSGWGPSSQLGGSVFNRASALESTLQSDEFWSFTITPDEILQLDSITFDFGGQDGNQPDFTASYEVRSSLTGTTNLGSNTVDITTSSATLFPQTVNLTDPIFDSVTTAVTFEIYYFTSGSSNSQLIRTDNVILNGVVVPEPSTAMLGLLAGAGFLLRRRSAQRA